jgi:hypothetical protein
VFPVTEAELQRKIERGADALLDLIAQKNPGICSTPGRLHGHRPSAGRELTCSRSPIHAGRRRA